MTSKMDSERKSGLMALHTKAFTKRVRNKAKVALSGLMALAMRAHG